MHNGGFKQEVVIINTQLYNNDIYLELFLKVKYTHSTKYTIMHQIIIVRINYNKDNL